MQRGELHRKVISNFLNSKIILEFLSIFFSNTYKAMILNRLKQFIDFKGISISAFERSVGMANATFGKALKNNGAIGTDKLEKILSVYSEISPVWLLTGEGEMLLPSISQSNISGANVIGENNTTNNQLSSELIDIIKSRDEEFKKREEQVDRLITLIEKLTGK